MKQLLDLQNEILSLREKLANHEREKLEKTHEKNDMVNCLLGQVTSLKRHIEKLESEKLSLIFEIEKLKTGEKDQEAKVANHKKLSETFKDALEIVNKKYIEQKCKHQSECDILTKKVEKTKLELNKEKKDLVEQSKIVDKKDQQIQFLRDELTSVKGQLQASLQKEREIMNLMFLTKEENETSKVNSTKLMQKIQRLNSQHNSLKEEAKIYKERTSCLEQKLEDKDFETEHKTEELEEKIKEANNVTNRRIETLRAEVKMKATKLAELEEVKRTMEEKEVLLQKERHLVESLTKELKKKEERIHQTEIQMRNEDNSKKKMDEERERNVKRRLEGLTEELRFERQRSKEQQHKVLCLVERLEEKENRIKWSAGEVESLKEELFGKNKETQGKIESLKENFHRSETENSKVVKELREMLNSSQEREDNIRGMLKEKEEELKNTMQQLLSTNNKLSVTIQNLATTQKIKATLENEIATTKQQVMLLKQKLMTLHQQLLTSRQHCVAVETAKADVETKLQHTTQQLDTLSQQHTSSSHDFVALKSALECSRQQGHLSSRQLQASRLKLHQIFQLEASSKQNVDDLSKELAETRHELKEVQNFITNNPRLIFQFSQYKLANGNELMPS